MAFTKPLPKIGILTGPTATGKSSIAHEFALRHKKIEIINADSLLVYRELKIGNAKPSFEERQAIAHHLLDLIDPDEPFTVGEFYKNVFEVIENIHARNQRALIVGGSGFYLKALLFGLWQAPKANPELRKFLESKKSETLFESLKLKDPIAALRMGPNDRYRIIRSLEIIEQSGLTPSELKAKQTLTANPDFKLFLIDRSNEDLFTRIQIRTESMLQQGLLEEVKLLRQKFPNSRALTSVGYRETIAFLEGNCPPGRKTDSSLDSLSLEITLATRQLVKKQRTWFRGALPSIPFILERDKPALLHALEQLYEV